MSDRIVTRAISHYVSWQGPEDAWQAFLDEDVQRNKFKHGGIAANTHQYAPCRTQPVGYDPVHSHERITENTKHVSLTSSPPEISFQDTTHAYECGYRDGIKAVQAKHAGIFRCDGCGRVTNKPENDLETLRKAGHLSCCPERKMVPLADIGKPITGDPISRENVADAMEDDNHFDPPVGREFGALPS